MKDIDNGLRYEVDGAGPYHIRNLVVSGRLVQADSVTTAPAGEGK